MSIHKIAVFCGANEGNSLLYRKSAEELADVLCKMGIALIYGGAKVGLMGIIAECMLQQGGKVIGVIPQSLVDVEIAHHGLTQLHVVNSMHERKALTAELADGFVMLPGGLGSLDEFFEMATWAQLGFHTKPCGILNINGYYNTLLQFLDHVTAEGFLKSVHRDMLIVAQSAQALLENFLTYQAPTDKKWITKTKYSPINQQNNIMSMVAKK